MIFTCWQTRGRRPFCACWPAGCRRTRTSSWRGGTSFCRPEVLRLGRHVWRIGAAQLRLEREELDAYARRCGAELSDHQVEQLLHTTEGWFSAAYLSLQTLAERGTLRTAAPISTPCSPPP